MPPLLSVVIPCFNQAQFLKETVQSVLGSTLTDVEIIIVDDGSTDDSAKIGLEIASAHPDKVRVITQKNSGPAAARNNGIRASTGKYILPLDSDDLIGKDYAKKAVHILEKTPDVKIVYCEAEKFGDQTGRWKLKTFSRKALATENVIFVSAFYRKSDWEACQGYDERMTWGWEDWEFWINMLKTGGEVVKIPEVGFYYRIRKDSRRKSTNKAMKQKTIDLINEKHNDFLKEQIGGPLRNPRSWSRLINTLQQFFQLR